MVSVSVVVFSLHFPQTHWSSRMVSSCFNISGLVGNIHSYHGGVGGSHVEWGQQGSMVNLNICKYNTPNIFRVDDIVWYCVSALNLREPPPQFGEKSMGAFSYYNASTLLPIGYTAPLHHPLSRQGTSCSIYLQAVEATPWGKQQKEQQGRWSFPGYVAGMLLGIVSTFPENVLKNPTRVGW